MSESYTKNFFNKDEYLDNSRKRVAKQSAEIRDHILQNEKVWGDGESIRDYEADCFLNRTNSIILRKEDLKSNFFYNEFRRDGEIDKFNSRGANYFVAINPLRDVSEKLDIIKQDVVDILSEIKKEGISWKEKAAMLDYCKQYALTLYHSLQKIDIFDKFR